MFTNKYYITFSITFSPHYPPATADIIHIGRSINTQDGIADAKKAAWEKAKVDEPRIANTAARGYNAVVLICVIPLDTGEQEA